MSSTKEYHKAYSKIYYQKNKDKILIYNREYAKTDEAKIKRNKNAKLYRSQIKNRVLSYYSNGNPKCARCGIDDMDVLCIDHVDGGGSKHRKEIRLAGSNVYKWLIYNDFPAGFQVLCANCNLKKRILENK